MAQNRDSNVDLQGKAWKDDIKLRCIGSILVLLGLVMPALITVQNIGIYETLMTGIYREQEVYVLIAALKLVLLNALRAYPHYMGVFFLIESFRNLKLRGKVVMTVAAACLLILGVYSLIDWIYQIRYDFGVPAVSMIVMVMILGKIDFRLVGVPKKVLMVAFLITALQFMDMMPMLWSFPFGRGETSYDIRLVSSFLDADGFLQATSTLFFALFLFMAILLLMLITDENNIRKISEQKELNERMLTEERMRNLENRTYAELRHLVHDLKSPLTSIQALAGVVKLSCAGKQDRANVEYLEQMEEIIENMSGMISEILYEERQSVVTTQEFLSSVMAQISAMDYVDQVRTENTVPDWSIQVNKIRFARVLVNVIENAAHAISRPGGMIRISVDGIQGNNGQEVRFLVRDNGSGIPQELLDEIWKRGFSRRNSSGLGLSFIKQVVEQCGGQVSLESVENQGTVVTVVLPRYQEE